MVPYSPLLRSNCTMTSSYLLSDLRRTWDIGTIAFPYKPCQIIHKIDVIAWWRPNWLNKKFTEVYLELVLSRVARVYLITVLSKETENSKCRGQPVQHSHPQYFLEISAINFTRSVNPNIYFKSSNSSGNEIRTSDCFRRL